MARIDARLSSQSPSLAARSKLINGEVTRPEGCQWVVIPDGAMIRVQDASYMSSVNEVFDTGSWKVEILLRASS